MKFLGKTQIDTTEEPDHLQFVVTRTSGWVEYLFPVAFIAAGGVALGLEYFLFGGILLAGAIFFLANLGKPSVDQLDISQSEIIARTNVKSTFSKTETVKSGEMQSLGYQLGREKQPGGLYASRGLLRQTCLLPGMNKQQANEIVDTICKKFPNYQR